jgi:Bifunctional DNA primase/polymerase, N-terminal/Primase C terminal 2 (PriCT-2)
MTTRSRSKSQQQKYPKSIAAAALLLAEEFGLVVFPAPPKTKRSYKSMRFCGGRRWGATNDPAKVARDWRRWPRANLGLPTGPENGIFVVEADTKAGHNVDGIKSLRALEREHGRLPKTLIAISPSGSLHYYFKWPSNSKIVIHNSASKIGAGVDVRGLNGMVLAPPSVKPGVGTYRFLNWGTPSAEAPAWLLKLVADKPRRRRGQQQTTTKNHFEQYGEPDMDLVIAALNVIPAEDYQVWFEVGSGLANDIGDTAFTLFDAWSATSRKYKPHECRAKWRECTRVRAYHIGTIFHHANEEMPGWRAAYEAKRITAAYSFFEK